MLVSLTISIADGGAIVEDNHKSQAQAQVQAQAQAQAHREEESRDQVMTSNKSPYKTLTNTAGTRVEEDGEFSAILQSEMQRKESSHPVTSLSECVH